MFALNTQDDAPAAPTPRPAPPNGLPRAPRATAWTLGIVALALISIFAIGSLRARDGAKPAAEQSPQERTTAFLRALYGMIANPDLYDSTRSAGLIEPLINEYMAPELRIAADTAMPDFGRHAMDQK